MSPNAHFIGSRCRDPSFPPSLKTRKGIHSLTKEYRQFLFNGSSHVCICVVWARQTGVRSQVVSRKLPSWPRGITLPGALQSHPDTSSSCLVTLAACSCLWAWVGVCKMGRIVSWVGIIWPLPMSQILTVFCTWVWWKDVVFKGQIVKWRDPGCHPPVRKMSGQEMISICLYQQSLRDKTIKMEITDKDMPSKSK